VNLATILEDSAQYFPDKDAIIEDDRVYTYREFNEYATSLHQNWLSWVCSPETM
jgi:non-ribosomal peptide synthetase component E (peptide arylation enzyme)